MLPTIVIGAEGELADKLANAWQAAGADPEDLYLYGDVEAAAFDLIDLEPEAFHRDEQGHWQVNILWGPLAWGMAAAGQTPELAHTGWTVLIGSSIRDDQDKPRRVVGGQVQGELSDTRIFEAAPKMRAQFVMDVDGQTNGQTSVAWLVGKLRDRETP